jgi:hypothetical protein
MLGMGTGVKSDEGFHWKSVSSGGVLVVSPDETLAVCVNRDRIRSGGQTRLRILRSESKA